MFVSGRILKMAVISVVVAALGACAPRPQTATSARGGEPPHAQGNFGTGRAPGVGAGAGTPSVNVTGGGLGNAEFSHPGAPGTGHAH